MPTIGTSNNKWGGVYGGKYDQSILVNSKYFINVMGYCQLHLVDNQL